jgi:hypothetical protein
MIHQHVIIGFLNFLLLYLSCSQMWLNPLVADHDFWTNMRKFEINKIRFEEKLINYIYIYIHIYRAEFLNLFYFPVFKGSQIWLIPLVDDRQFSHS